MDTVLTGNQLLTYSNHWVEEKAVLLLLPHLLGNCMCAIFINTPVSIQYGGYCTSAIPVLHGNYCT